MSVASVENLGSTLDMSCLFPLLNFFHEWPMAKLTLFAVITSTLSGLGFFFLTLVFEYSKKCRRDRKEKENAKLFNEMLRKKGLREVSGVDGRKTLVSIQDGKAMGENLFHTYKTSGEFLGVKKVFESNTSIPEDEASVWFVETKNNLESKNGSDKMPPLFSQPDGTDLEKSTAEMSKTQSSGDRVRWGVFRKQVQSIREKSLSEVENKHLHGWLSEQKQWSQISPKINTGFAQGNKSKLTKKRMCRDILLNYPFIAPYLRPEFFREADVPDTGITPKKETSPAQVSKKQMSSPGRFKMSSPAFRGSLGIHRSAGSSQRSAGSIHRSIGSIHKAHSSSSSQISVPKRALKPKILSATIGSRKPTLIASNPGNEKNNTGKRPPVQPKINTTRPKVKRTVSKLSTDSKNIGPKDKPVPASGKVQLERTRSKLKKNISEHSHGSKSSMEPNFAVMTPASKPAGDMSTECPSLVQNLGGEKTTSFSVNDGKISPTVFSSACSKINLDDEIKPVQQQKSLAVPEQKSPKKKSSSKTRKRRKSLSRSRSPKRDSKQKTEKGSTSRQRSKTKEPVDSELKQQTREKSPVKRTKRKVKKTASRSPSPKKTSKSKKVGNKSNTEKPLQSKETKKKIKEQTTSITKSPTETNKPTDESKQENKDQEKSPVNIFLIQSEKKADSPKCDITQHLSQVPNRQEERVSPKTSKLSGNDFNIVTARDLAHLLLKDDEIAKRKEHIINIRYDAERQLAKSHFECPIKDLSRDNTMKIDSMQCTRFTKKEKECSFSKEKLEMAFESVSPVFYMNPNPRNSREIFLRKSALDEVTREVQEHAQQIRTASNELSGGGDMTLTGDYVKSTPKTPDKSPVNIRCEQNIVEIQPPKRNVEASTKPKECEQRTLDSNQSTPKNEQSRCETRSKGHYANKSPKERRGDSPTQITKVSRECIKEVKPPDCIQQYNGVHVSGSSESSLTSEVHCQGAIPKQITPIKKVSHKCADEVKPDDCVEQHRLNPTDNVEESPLKSSSPKAQGGSPTQNCTRLFGSEASFPQTSFAWVGQPALAQNSSTEDEFVGDAFSQYRK